MPNHLPPEHPTAPTYTLPELVAAVVEDLQRWQKPANGQVRAVPDLRTLRWYSQVGLLDRPLAWRGRTALYGDRHRLQVLAVKRLQGRDLSLDQIQVRLLGLDDLALQNVIADQQPVDAAPAPQSKKLAPPLIAVSAPPAVAPTTPPPARRARFWEQAPAVTAVAPLQAVLRVDLGGGARLELPGAGLDEQAWAALGPALAPLRAWLQRHLPPTSASSPSVPPQEPSP